MTTRYDIQDSIKATKLNDQDLWMLECAVWMKRDALAKKVIKTLAIGDKVKFDTYCSYHVWGEVIALGRKKVTVMGKNNKVHKVDASRIVKV